MLVEGGSGIDLTCSLMSEYRPKLFDICEPGFVVGHGSECFTFSSGNEYYGRRLKRVQEYE